MSKLSRLTAPLLAIILLAGCGGTSKHPAQRVHHVIQAPGAVFCSGLTNKCVTVGAVQKLNPLLASECKIPDVSNWQGHVNWAEARPHICGGIYKGGEALARDTFAADNNSQLSALHIWHALYWYIRNVGCSAEADAIASEAHAFHVLVVINDLESAADNQGYGSCLPPLEKKAGLIPVDYTSKGTWSSGDGGFGTVPLWQAEYGPTLHPLWNPVVLWQCTDGHFGCVTSVPGIGVDDVSVNLGITKLGAKPPPPPTPSCWGHDRHSGTCKQVRRDAYLLAQRERSQTGFLKVSRANAGRLQTQVTPLRKRLAGIDARASVELRAHRYSELKLSAANALAVEVRLVPLTQRLDPILARVRAESSRAAALHRQRCALLAKYHRAC